MVDDLEERLSRYRADLDAAVAADLARRRLASREARFDDADPRLLDTDHEIRLERTSAPYERRRVMLVATLVAATVTTLVLVALLAVRDDATPADQPSPTAPPLPLVNYVGGQLAPGRYFVGEVSGTPTPRIFATIGAGWWLGSTGSDGGFFKRDTDTEVPRDEVGQHDIGFMSFSNPVAVYADACHWEDGYHPGPVDTVDGLVAALTEQQGWAEITTPRDISIDGYVGKAFQRTAPVDMSDCSIRFGRSRVSDEPPGAPGDRFPDFRSWDNPHDKPGFYYEPGQIETLWVLDLDGTVVVIQTAVWPEPSAGAAPDFAADVLDSIRIERS